ncbi:unnamed protein product, partial [Closterium sp. Yama58-4]
MRLSVKSTNLEGRTVKREMAIEEIGCRRDRAGFLRNNSKRLARPRFPRPSLF